MFTQTKLDLRVGTLGALSLPGDPQPPPSTLQPSIPPCPSEPCWRFNFRDYIPARPLRTVCLPLLCFAWFRPIYCLQLPADCQATMRIFPPHTHIDGFHDPQLTPTLKPNKTTQRRTYRAQPKGLIDKWGPLALPWLLTLVWCDASASVSL